MVESLTAGLSSESVSLWEKNNGIFTSLYPIVEQLHVWLCLTDFTDYYIFFKVSVKT